jgi:hypothetical protein
LDRKGPVELSTKAGAAKKNLLKDREQGEHETKTYVYESSWS